MVKIVLYQEHGQNVEKEVVGGAEVGEQGQARPGQAVLPVFYPVNQPGTLPSASNHHI